MGGVSDPFVHALTIYDGMLIAGGYFTDAGGVSANYIAAWDGNTWTSIGSGMDYLIYDVYTYDDKLIAGGMFSTAGGINVNNIAAWDGFSWSALGSGIEGEGMAESVDILKEYDGVLIVGGYFSTAGGASANHIAAWDGSSWSALGSGLGGTYAYVQSLNVFDNEVIVGGGFTRAGDKVAAYLAQWTKNYDYTSGDANGDDNVNVSDAVFIINFAFSGGAPPNPLDAGDANCDVSVNVSDAVYIINYAFSGGYPPGDPDGDGNPDC